MGQNIIYNKLTICIYMIATIKKLFSILSGRGYFLSDKSDKNISLGIVPKTLKKSKSFNLIFTGIQKDFRLIEA